MIKYKNLFWLLLYVAPFINFSVIPGSKLPLAYLSIILIFLILLVTTRTIPKRTFGLEDLCFGLFVVVSLIAIQLNSPDYSIARGLIQLSNIILTYSIYKISLFLLQKSDLDGEDILRKAFNYNSKIQLIAFILFLSGFYSHDFLKGIVDFFNNAGNFSIGAFSTVFPRARLIGFSPEPSFWSFFVAFNLAIGLTLEKPKKSYIIINIISLIFTFGRTGYLIGICIILIKFIKGHILYKALAIVIAGIGFIFFYEFLSINSLLGVDSSFRQRIGSLITAVDIARDHPLFGIGLGNFHTYAKVHRFDFLDIFNFFLTLLVASGLFGLLTFVSTLGSIYSRMRAIDRLPFFASIIGWMTMSAYNLPYVWLVYAIFVYISIKKEAPLLQQ
jgi:hypothetical protein